MAFQSATRELAVYGIRLDPEDKVTESSNLLHPERM
jgi:hypothetical protein